MDRPIQRTVIIVGACQKIHSPPIKYSVTDFFTGEEKDDDEQIVVRVKLYLHFSFNSITFSVKNASALLLTVCLSIKTLYNTTILYLVSCKKV